MTAAAAQPVRVPSAARWTWLKRLRLSADVKHSDFRLAHVLAEDADQGGKVAASIVTLASRAGMSAPVATASLKRLAEGQHIAMERFHARSVMVIRLLKAPASKTAVSSSPAVEKASQLGE